MRLVSWNCCDAFNRKFGHLGRLHPDIAVLQEVRPECLKSAGVASRSAWLGDPGQKGVAVVPYGDWQLSPAPRASAERWFLPVIAKNGADTVHILAVWVDSAMDCVPPTLRALDELGGFLKGAPCIVAGDFNQTVTLDKGKVSGHRYADVLDALSKLGLTSAWHEHHSEQQGQETSATLYWRWNETANYHIDFAFASEDLQAASVSLGTFDQYVRGEISDHVPLTVDYAFRPRPR